MAGKAKTVAELVAAAKQGIENLTVEEVASELEEGNAVLVDIRESEERIQNGFIPGAVHLPRGMLEFYADPASPSYRSEIAPDKRVILHCAAGARSALGVRALQELGYTNVAHLEGGFRAWATGGQPVEKERLGM
ncbi:MAG TPA: rhodanese-like domain-containing protein [Acidimicrobiales bacterium]|nr:rhodanese-like domain-containing protein [Acidimicrobiales bacterium]